MFGFFILKNLILVRLLGQGSPNLGNSHVSFPHAKFSIIPFNFKSFGGVILDRRQ